MSLKVKVEISRIKLPVVMGAYFKDCPNPLHSPTKSQAVDWLYSMVSDGRMTINDIMSAPEHTVSAAPAIDPATVAKIDAAGATASRAHDATMKHERAIAQLADLLVTDRKVTDGIARQVDSLSDKVGSFKVDPALIAQSVASAIAAEFAPFKRAVQDLQAESIVADLSSVHVTDVKPVYEVFGVDVRDVKGQIMTVALWNDPSAPAIDPDFIWTEDILRHLLQSDKTGESLWFGGERGTGKSTVAQQFAARTGRGFKRINFHKHTAAEEYLGATGLVDGNTVFEPRDFLMAYSSPSTIILLDEVTNCDAGELAPLNGLLEPDAAVSIGGRVWRRAQGVLVFAADNTLGNGDESGRYVGTRPMNSALIDRFARVIPFTFLPQDEEIKAIVQRTGCSQALADYVHMVIRVARGKVDTADIVDAPSIRSVMAFIRALPYIPARQAWETTVVARQPSESHAVLRGLYETHIDEVFIINNI
jgi:MoxR-like ATPase